MGNLNYWTGGVQSCKGRWGWCNGTGNQFSPLSAQLTWAMDQPEMLKEKENCLHMQVHPNNGILLSDRECKHRYLYACQACIFRFIFQYDDHLEFTAQGLQSRPIDGTNLP